MASRLDFVPINRRRSERLPFETIVAIESGRALVGGDQQVQIAVAVEIAIGAPRPTLGAAKSAPASAATSRNAPWPSFRNRCGGCA